MSSEHREGLCVVKVFAIQDPSLPLKTYQDQLTDIKNRLVTAPNVLPFHHSILTDKASLLIRQFIKDNLYDRIRSEYFIKFEALLVFSLRVCRLYLWKYQHFIGSLIFSNFVACYVTDSSKIILLVTVE